MTNRKNRNAETRKPEILEAYYQVLIEKGFEGSSIGKIAEYLNIHSTLILHYFKNKENLQRELIEFLVSKYKSEHMLGFNLIEDSTRRFDALMNLMFSYKWNRTVDPGVHFGFYYKSFRDEGIRRVLNNMFLWLRDYLHDAFIVFNKEGVIRVSDELKAADYVLTLMEGLEFHAHFLNEGKPFEDFAQTARAATIAMLKNGTF
ncbi:TetR/AcrR family transcriptional regulator [uncultured Desulfobacter sp.]|uniref:TetR/AcrR family transcriptional regulator n=1 Tax=uncultured Desulfobacter sp. TaxID=240139 RepID=UPI002AAAC9E1|nr:TetR/AcrR family transcriptional regulator [uncultured Desulfobacter sp.]